MNYLQKWGLMASLFTASLGIASPALADFSADDVAVIAQVCVAIDRGELTETDLDMLDDEEYAALMSACGFVSDGSVSEAEMSVFEEYYVVFQEDIVSVETVVEHTVVTEEYTEEVTVEEYTEETVEEYTEEEMVEEYTEETVEEYEEEETVEEYTEETVEEYEEEVAEEAEEEAEEEE